VTTPSQPEDDSPAPPPSVPAGPAPWPPAGAPPPSPAPPPPGVSAQAYGPQGYGYPYPYPLPGAPYGVDRFGRPYSEKSKIVAGVLQLVLGGFGAGRWYTGHYGIAVAQLLTCGGLGVWALIDGIMMLVGDVTDPQGRPLRG
jgi:TM2 domain